MSPARRVLAINNIDLVDRAGLERYVASLRSSPREEVRAVMAPATQTAFVAAGARLLIHARAKGALEGLEYSFHDPEWLDGLRDGMDTLRSMIEQRLTARRGQEFIESHRAYLLWIADLLDIECDKAREDLAAAREYLRIKRGDVDARRRELQSFKAKLRGAIDELRSASKGLATCLMGSRSVAIGLLRGRAVLEPLRRRCPPP